MGIDAFTLYSGGAAGAESAFGQYAEQHGLAEVNFTFDGHAVVRNRGLYALSPEELAQGDAALVAIARHIHRQLPGDEGSRRLLLSIWHQVHHGEAVFVVGRIQGDGTVTGGTGWGAEYAKQCNKPLYVFDQARDAWYRWRNRDWEPEAAPSVVSNRFTGTGTRFLEPNGHAAIAGLFARSFRGRGGDGL
jgi:hypothetical protein